MKTPKQSNVIHHYHIRKRIYKKHEQFPHPQKLKNFMDKAIYPIGILGPVMTVPQLLEVWTTKDVSGLSLLTWSSWVIIASFWLFYGVLHKEIPIILSYALWILVELGVVVGIILYK